MSIGDVSTDSGSVMVTSEQKLHYTPKLGFEGTVTVHYQVSDGKGASDNGRLFVSVTAPVVTPPPPPTDNGGSDGGGSLAVTLLVLAILWQRRKQDVRNTKMTG